MEAFIICRTARYIGKIARTSEDNYQKKVPWCLDENLTK
jgi:hypothetical protein